MKGDGARFLKTVLRRRSILTDAAYFASRYVIVPVKPEFMATNGLSGISDLRTRTTRLKSPTLFSITLPATQKDLKGSSQLRKFGNKRGNMTGIFSLKN